MQSLPSPTALGTLNQKTQSRFLSRELRMAFALSLILLLAAIAYELLLQSGKGGRFMDL